ncbi:MAG TPA: radical SAM protein, partial [Verrucomicrobiae bacterium]|nr:radical SAM protein [Verrucomicrobiae bacterium]
MGEKRPDSPDFHLFETNSGNHLFLANGSRLYSVPPDLVEALRAGHLPTEEILASCGLAAPPYIEDAPVPGPPLRAISLAIAEACNLGCVYCYAQQGSFGRKAQMMERESALGAIDLLFQSANRGDRVQITFLGGEPLANRTLLRESTEYAVRLAESTGIAVGFAITTNGTLVLPEDCEFLERHGFAVTISLDGSGGIHDRLRPFADGSGSYNRIIARICPLLERQSCMQVSARVTVTPANLALQETLDALIGMGFHSVGFSPMLSSPNHSQEMTPATLNDMLCAMIQCGEAFESHLYRNERYPFFNLMTA